MAELSDRIRPALEAVAAVDEFVDRGFARLRGRPGADEVFWAASEIADMSMGWHLLNAGLVLADPDRLRPGLRLAGALGVESALVNGGIKPWFRRPRPPARTDTTLLTRRPKTASFPSGHASSATLAAVLLGEMLPARRPLWTGLAAVVALSRVHNRQHHASDVAAGAVVGWGLARLVQRVVPL